MKNHVKDALHTLEALDFRLDHEDRKLRTDRWVFTHANSPDERLTLNYRMSEPAARTVVQKARAIVGLATSEPGSPRRPRADARQKAERAAERRRIEAARRLAAAKEEERRAHRLASAAERRYTELDGLLRGRSTGRGPREQVGAALPTDGMLTVEQVADNTGLTDKTVRRAIDSGSLEAYMCSGTVKVKSGDVRSWLALAAS